MKVYTESELQLIVSKNGEFIKFVENPSSAVRNIAIKQNGMAVRFLDNPTVQEMATAVNQSAPAIQYLPQAPTEIKIAAVSKIGGLIGGIKNPTTEEQLVAVTQQPNSVVSLVKPPLDVQIKATLGDRNVLTLIDEPEDLAIESVFDRIVEENLYPIIMSQLNVLQAMFPKPPFPPFSDPDDYDDTTIVDPMFTSLRADINITRKFVYPTSDEAYARTRVTFDNIKEEYVKESVLTPSADAIFIEVNDYLDLLKKIGNYQ